MPELKPQLSQPLIRQQNLSAALRLVRETGRITRTELARAMKLSKPAITRIAGDLVQAGFIHETSRRAANARGRPSQFLELRPGQHYFVGLDIRLDRIAIQARDLDGSQLASHRHDPEHAATADGLLEFLADRLSALKSQVGRHPTGVGISVPAAVDRARQTLEGSNNPALRGLPLPRLLADRMGWEHVVYRVADVAHCAALGNWSDIEALGRRNLVHIQIGLGAGIGFVSRDFPAGNGPIGFKRFGHIPMTANGPRCVCGAYGCLDAVAGFEAMAHHAESAGIIRNQGPDAIPQFCEALLHAHRSGSDEATRAITESAQWLGRAAATIMNLVDPEAVTIGGYPLQLGEPFLDQLNTTMEQHAPGSAARLTSTKAQDEASVQGAVILAMEPTLSDPLKLNRA